MLKQHGFDEWSKKYDEHVQNSVGYPFEGYNDLMNEIVNEIDYGNKPSVLDVGIGTGTLSSLLNTKGATITGLDFSSEMIKVAESRIKNGIFYVQDLSNGLPKELNNTEFNYIISTYVIHHFCLDQKITLIVELLNHLKPGGKLLIGDVAFQTEADLIRCKEQNKDCFDHDELYIVADEIIKALQRKDITAKYKQISSCAGVVKVIK
ncbi:class I SAM-dependent DNA methyltransferase [Haloplasma contractile]|uniref:SAM-dependent methyltransferase protein n=1 Tax=Haloplasma contractile SSD-17B TaxID=1033810 RepID=U2EA88_9MOLU|nr:class I SAM-dependent methyltransferase [Haloplasma contractile]ERJ12008.1 SAM-dependent methyltransferase protein [Haloplasma contractile SSD-17B]